MLIEARPSVVKLLEYLRRAAFGKELGSPLRPGRTGPGLVDWTKTATSPADGGNKSGARGHYLPTDVSFRANPIFFGRPALKSAGFPIRVGESCNQLLFFNLRTYCRSFFGHGNSGFRGSRGGMFSDRPSHALRGRGIGTKTATRSCAFCWQNDSPLSCVKTHIIAQVADISQSNCLSAQ